MSNSSGGFINYIYIIIYIYIPGPSCRGALSGSLSVVFGSPLDTPWRVQVYIIYIYTYLYMYIFETDVGLQRGGPATGVCSMGQLSQTLKQSVIDAYMNLLWHPPM